MAPLVIREPDFNWEGMLKWWSAHSDGSHSPVSEEQDKNFMERMEKRKGNPAPFLYDVIDQVHQTAFLFNPDKNDRKHIHESLAPHIRKSPEVQAMLMLNNLLFYAEYVYVAEALDEIGILDILLDTVLCYEFDCGVYNKYAGVRAKAAEVVTAMVQNNPSSQKLVMEVNGLQTLVYNFVKDPDVTSRTKALGAISALIRNNQPGITAFLLDNDGYAALSNALSSESVGFQREALNLIQYLLHENSSDCNIVTQLGIPRIMMHLTSSDDEQVREASLRGLLVLARNENGGNSGQLVKNDDKLKQVLLERIKGLLAMVSGLSASGNLYAANIGAAAKVEIQLVNSLWVACYNESSALALIVF